MNDLFTNPFSFMVDPPSKDVTSVTFDPEHILTAIASGGAGAFLGLIAGVWRANHIKQDVKSALSEEFNAKIDTLKESIVTKIANSEQQLEEKIIEAADHFSETLHGLREKINNVELNTEREFVPKSGFDEFRKEHRSDMQRLMDKLDQMAVRPA
jgi:hypothetical protein